MLKPARSLNNINNPSWWLLMSARRHCCRIQGRVSGGELLLGWWVVVILGQSVEDVQSPVGVWVVYVSRAVSPGVLIHPCPLLITPPDARLATICWAFPNPTAPTAARSNMTDSPKPRPLPPDWQKPTALANQQPGWGVCGPAGRCCV